MAEIRFRQSRGGIVIEGLDIVADDLERAGLTAGIRASRALIPRANRMAQEMRDNAPVGATGRLRDSFTATTPDGDPLGLGDLEADIGSDFFTSRFFELGTSKMAPRPIVQPVADHHEPLFHTDMGRVAGGDT